MVWTVAWCGWWHVVIGGVVWIKDEGAGEAADWAVGLGDWLKHGHAEHGNAQPCLSDPQGTCSPCSPCSPCSSCVLGDRAAHALNGECTHAAHAAARAACVAHAVHTTMRPIHTHAGHAAHGSPSGAAAGATRASDPCRACCEGLSPP
eukprot:321936-Chlamydomonas_euryale.AAC.1